MKQALKSTLECSCSFQLRTAGFSGVLGGQFLADEAAQAFQVLAVELDVVVAGSFHPQRLHGLGAALEQGEAVGEIDHLVLGAVDDQDWRRDL